MFRRGGPAPELLQLLARERECILSGRYDALEQLLLKRERMLSALIEAPRGELGCKREELEAIERGIRRNTRLIGAAQTGAARARERIAGLTAAADGFSTYFSNGMVQRQVGASPKVTRRA